MAMAGSTTNTFVKPALSKRTAPLWMPRSLVSVYKATRDFDTFVHEAASTGVGQGYELPKNAYKAGVSTVDIDLTEPQVALLFPDPNVRAAKKGKATFIERLISICVFFISAITAKVFYDTYYIPVVTWYDIARYSVNAFCDMVGVSIQSVCAAVMFATACVSSFIWDTFVVDSTNWMLAVPLMGVPIIACMLLSRTFSPGAICFAIYASYGWVTRIMQGIGECYTSWVTVPRQYICANYRFPAGSWLCPPAAPTRVQRLMSAVVSLYWWVLPNLRDKLVLQSLGVFVVMYVLLKWLTRRQTIWVVRLRVESQALSVARTQKTRAMQETTSDKVAACPIITHVENHVRVTHARMPIEVRDKYLAVCILVASAWADNRLRIVQATAGEPDVTTPQETTAESRDASGSKKRLLPTRNNQCKPNSWRRSVRVFIKSWFKLFDDIQRGQDRKLPDADEQKEHYSGVVTGPELYNITEGFEGSCEDEVAGVSRHLRQLKSTITDDYLNPVISAEAEARLELATLTICTIVAALAREDFLEILNWALPKKWGSSREKYYQKLVEIGRTTVSPFLSGFVKLGELALPVTKLPRLVGSMGMACCAKDAAVLCSVENLFKRLCPQLVVKGMTQDETNGRFARFCRRAKRLCLKILSIDMSAMDSSWTPGDRKRVRKVMQTIIDVLKDLLEADFQEDYVTQCHGRRVLRWILKYIEVQLAAEDSILFSGERGTSIGNRILMLIIWGAELIRVFGETLGCEKIRRMFFCPPEAKKYSTDEGPSGQHETIDVADDKFPEHPDYDNNLGDGDDATMAIPETMYASREEFILAYEQYFKLVEPCSAWSEGTDLECLSMMCITSGSEQFFIPKVGRNAQRLIAHKINVVPGKHFAEGNPTYIPRPNEWAEIATDLWQRSYALRHTMVSRHMCRAMFEYAFSKAGNIGTVYSDDHKRLGKVDGDRRLADCLEDVRKNAAYHVSSYAMIKATNFDRMNKLHVKEIAALKSEWFSSDSSWSNMELTDDLCANPDVLLTSFPVGPNVGTALGFQAKYVQQCATLQALEQVETSPQLVKPQETRPDMSSPGQSGSSESGAADGETKPPVRAASVLVVKVRSGRDGDNPGRWSSVLCGYEPAGKKRQGWLTIPAGKVEGTETFREAAARELMEEGGLVVDPQKLEFVRKHTCAGFECEQFRINYIDTSAASTLCADRLLDLKFRTGVEIYTEHAPSRIAACLKDTYDGMGYWLPGMLEPDRRPMSGPGPLVRTTAYPSNGPGHVIMRPVGSSPDHSSPQESGLFEVESPVAEAGEMGPADPDLHCHVCPVCSKEYYHSHPHAPGREHKQRRGACTNAGCSNCGNAKKSQDSAAATSSNVSEVRQQAQSRPVNGYGTRGADTSKGKGKGKEIQSGLSTQAVTSNAGKSRASAAESKGQSKGKGESESKHSKVSTPGREAQTAVGAKTPVPDDKANHRTTISALNLQPARATPEKLSLADHNRMMAEMARIGALDLEPSVPVAQEKWRKKVTFDEPHHHSSACPAVTNADYTANWMINHHGSCASEDADPVGSRASGTLATPAGAPTSAEQAGNSGQQVVKADDRRKRPPPGLEDACGVLDTPTA